MSGGRREWFERCVRAVARVRPDLDGLFICPLCLNGFDSVDDVAQEHAPPRAVGGHKVALTCKFCNHTAGHELDVHMRKFENIVDLGTQTLTEPVRVVFGMADSAMSAMAINTEAGLKIIGHPESTDPTEHAALVAHLDGLAATGGWYGEKFTLTFRDRVTYANVRSGWLRAAYLVGFAKFGYRYILRPELDPVRAQVAEPAKEHAPRAVLCNYELPAATRGLWIVERPSTLKSIHVAMGRWAVFLPGLGTEPDFYGRLARRKRWPLRGTLHGKSAPWPTEPELNFDWIDIGT